MLIALCSAVTLLGCANKPQSRQQDTTRRQLSDYDKAVEAQSADPQMLEYMRSICARPQPERAQLGNDLIRTHRIVAQCAFDKEHPADLAAANGPTLLIPAGKNE
jgi:hypothetical protein